MKPVHLVLFLRALKSPNTDEAVDQKEPKETVFVSGCPPCLRNGHGVLRDRGCVLVVFLQSPSQSRRSWVCL